MADQSIERKIFFGFAFSVGVLIFVSSLALYRGNDYIRGSLLVRHTQSGRENASLHPPPLGTGRAGFPASGSGR